VGPEHARVLAPVVALLVALGAWAIGLPEGDLANYVTAGHLWLAGEPLHQLYDYRWFTGAAVRAGYPDALVGFPVLTPPSALLGAPLAWLGPVGAAWAWALAQLGLLGLVGATLLRSDELGGRWTPLLFLALWPAIGAHLQQGQFHLPAVAAVALGGLALSRGRDVWAGTCWGLAVGLKVHAWPLLVVLGLWRRWGGVVAGLAVLVAGGLVSIGLLGLPVHARWWTEIVPAAASGWFVHPFHLGQQSIGHALRAALVPHAGLNPHALLDAPAWAGWGARAAAGLVLGGTLASVAGASAGSRARSLAAAGLAALATGPLLASYHLVLLLPLVAWGASGLWSEGERRRAVAVVSLASVAVWAPTSTYLAGPGDLLWGLPRPWALLAMVGLLLPRWGWKTAAGALVGVLLAGLPRGPSIADEAVPFEASGAPFVAAELTGDGAGGLWLSGLPTARGELPGRGWIGLEVDVPGQRFVPVAGADGSHRWHPQLVDGEITWSSSVEAGVSAAVPGPLGGRLEASPRDGGSDIRWVGPSGEERWLTSDPAWDSDPHWDPVRQRIWFLSDRGAGVRCLRLWWLPWRSVAAPDVVAPPSG